MWYRTSNAKELLEVTAQGKFTHVWEAEDIEGKIIYQFDDMVQLRAVKDRHFIVPFDPSFRRSVDFLDRSRIKRFTLIPVARVQDLPMNPFVPLSVYPELDKQEMFKSYWLVDKDANTGYTLCRTVIGIERVIVPEGVHQFDLTVISPSGSVRSCHNDNQSFEGE